MSAAGFAMLAVAVLVAYEALKHLQVASAAGGSSAPSGPATSPSLGGGAAGSVGGTGYAAGPPPGSSLIVDPSQIVSGLMQNGVPLGAAQQFLGIVNRESGFNAYSTCWAPGADAGKCTPQQKPGDTQVAQGLFQFLSTTWRGYGCQGSPFDPSAAIACAATAWKQRGFGDWGG